MSGTPVPPGLCISCLLLSADQPYSLLLWISVHHIAVIIMPVALNFHILMSMPQEEQFKEYQGRPLISSSWIGSHPGLNSWSPGVHVHCSLSGFWFGLGWGGGGRCHHGSRYFCHLWHAPWAHFKFSSKFVVGMGSLGRDFYFLLLCWLQYHLRHPYLTLAARDHNSSKQVCGTAPWQPASPTATLFSTSPGT